MPSSMYPSHNMSCILLNAPKHPYHAQNMLGNVNIKAKSILSKLEMKVGKFYQNKENAKNEVLSPKSLVILFSSLLINNWNLRIKKLFNLL
jgi:hypothetical protein